MTACKSGINLLSWVCVLFISSGSVGKNLSFSSSRRILHYSASNFIVVFLLVLFLESFGVFYRKKVYEAVDFSIILSSDLCGKIFHSGLSSDKVILTIVRFLHLKPCLKLVRDYQ